MKFFHDEAVVLRKRHLREKDEVIIMFSKAHGKLALMSFGSRDPKSRKAGVLALFNTVAFEARESKSKMPTIQQVKHIKARGFQIVQEGECLEEFYRAAEIVKMVDKYLHESQIVQSVYDDLNSSLNFVATKSIVEIFWIRLLSDLGYLPDWSSCCICHEKLDLEQSIVLVLENNGFAHRNCIDLKKEVGCDLVKVMSFFQRHSIEEAVRVEISNDLLVSITDIMKSIDIDI